MGKQWKQWEAIFGGSKITAGGDHSHEIKRHLLLGRKVMTNLLLLPLSHFSHIWLCATPYTAAHQAPLSLGFSRQETGVGCHFLLQCMKVKSESEVAQSCLTLGDPTDCSLPGSSVHGILKARVLGWVAIAFSDDQPRQRIKKQRHCFANKGPSSQSYSFFRSYVWMWELDYKESWAPKNWCFWTVVLEKTLESPLDFKEIQPVSPKGNQSWMFIGRTDAEAETPKLWAWCKELTHWKKPWCWERLKAGGEGDNKRWDGWMASPTWWTWVWASRELVMDGEAWRAAVHGITKIWTQLSDWTELKTLSENRIWFLQTVPIHSNEEFLLTRLKSPWWLGFLFVHFIVLTVFFSTFYFELQTSIHKPYQWFPLAYFFQRA